MVCVMCSWCQYLGQGSNWMDKIRDVQRHEDGCPDRIADELANGEY